MAPTPKVALIAPARSKRPGRRTVSGRYRGASRIIAAPIGTLRKNPALQDTQSANAPPSTKPKLDPMPAVAPYRATAFARSFPAGKLAVSSDSDDGATIAAPTP